MSTITVQFIDPPSGWKYGFPKPIPKKVKDISEWLIEQGYPRKLKEGFKDHFYCRYWTKAVTEDELRSLVGHSIKLEDYACDV